MDVEPGRALKLFFPRGELIFAALRPLASAVFQQCVHEQRDNRGIRIHFACKLPLTRNAIKRRAQLLLAHSRGFARIHVDYGEQAGHLRHKKLKLVAIAVEPAPKPLARDLVFGDIAQAKSAMAFLGLTHMSLHPRYSHSIWSCLPSGEHGPHDHDGPRRNNRPGTAPRRATLRPGQRAVAGSYRYGSKPARLQS